MKKYIDGKFLETNTKMEKSTRNCKRSLQFDLKQRFDQVTDVLNSVGLTVDEVEAARRVLDTNLPVSTDEDFMRFNETIATNQEKKRALVSP